jgi:thioredoxin 1
MTETNKKTDAGAACGCDRGSCCSGSTKWIWVVLALAVAGVLVMKHAGKKETLPTPLAGTTLPGVETSSTNAVMQAKALPLLVDLGAGKCIPCKLMAPILEELKTTLAGKLTVQFIDVWQNPDAGKQYGIKMIPTQIFYDAQGKELFRHEGFFGKADILSKWNEFGVDLRKNSESRSQNPE